MVLLSSKINELHEMFELCTFGAEPMNQLTPSLNDYKKKFLIEKMPLMFVVVIFY